MNVGAKGRGDGVICGTGTTHGRGNRIGRLAILDVSPARDCRFRDLVLVQKHSVAPSSLDESSAREYHLYR